MAINKDVRLYRSNTESLGILVAKFPGKTLVPGYTAKGGGYYLKVTYCPVPLPFATFEENLGTSVLSMAKNPIESCIETVVASIGEDVGGRLSTIDSSTKHVENVRMRRWLGRRRCRHSSSGAPRRVNVTSSMAKRPSRQQPAV